MVLVDKSIPRLDHINNLTNYNIIQSYKLINLNKYSKYDDSLDNFMTHFSIGNFNPKLQYIQKNGPFNYQVINEIIFKT